MAHNLRLASWEPGTPASFEATPLGTSPKGGGFSCALSVCCCTRLQPYIQRCRADASAKSLDIWKNTVVFFHLVLRQTTRTLFSSQGAPAIFFWYRRKTVMQGLKPQSPHHCLLRGVACGGLKPCSVTYTLASNDVWCPNYRKKILGGKRATFVEQEIRRICETNTWTRGADPRASRSCASLSK